MHWLRFSIFWAPVAYMGSLLLPYVFMCILVKKTGVLNLGAGRQWEVNVRSWGCRSSTFSCSTTIADPQGVGGGGKKGKSFWSLKKRQNKVLLQVVETGTQPWTDRSCSICIGTRCCWNWDGKLLPIKAERHNDGSVPRQTLAGCQQQWSKICIKESWQWLLICWQS